MGKSYRHYGSNKSTRNLSKFEDDMVDPMDLEIQFSEKKKIAKSKEKDKRQQDKFIKTIMNKK